MALFSRSSSSSARLSVVTATDVQLKAVADIGPEIDKGQLDFCPCAIGPAIKCFLHLL